MKNNIALSISESDDLQEFVPVSQSLEQLSEFTCRYNYSSILFNDNYRSSKNFMEANFCILDFDGNLSIANAKVLFADYKALLVTTKSHQQCIKNGKAIEKQDRFRIILQFDKTIMNLSQYEIVMTNAISDFKSDEACADGARFFYPNPYQAIWISKGTKYIEVAKYNREPKQRKMETIATSKSEVNISGDIEIIDKYGNKLSASQWIKELDNSVTHTVFCPNPEHDDRHPSAFITLSRYKKYELFIYCHKCGPLVISQIFSGEIK